MNIKKEMPSYTNKKKLFEKLMDKNTPIGRIRLMAHMAINRGMLFCVIFQHNSLYEKESRKSFKKIQKLMTLINKNYDVIHLENNLDSFSKLEKSKICFLISDIRKDIEYFTLGEDELPEPYYSEISLLSEEWEKSGEKKVYTELLERKNG